LEDIRTNRRVRGGSDFLRILTDIAIIAICVAAMSYMLFNVHLRKAPKVQDARTKSHQALPATQPSTTASPTLVSAP
jgi:cytochrome c biogenesis protein ResB